LRPQRIAITVWQQGSTRTCWGSLQRSPGPLAGFEGPLCSKEGEGRKGGKGKGGEGVKREGRKDGKERGERRKG